MSRRKEWTRELHVKCSKIEDKIIYGLMWKHGLRSKGSAIRYCIKQVGFHEKLVDVNDETLADRDPEIENRY
jgi:hypothetical protein